MRLWSILSAAAGSSIVEGERGGEDSIALSLPGRYRAANGNEFECEMTSISPSGISIKGPVIDPLGKWTTAQFDALGFIEGVIVQSTPVTFVVDVRVTAARLERLSRRIVWNLRRIEESLRERRKSERVEVDRRDATLETSDGQSLPCQMLDISAGGAALHLGNAALYLWLGQPVRLDNRPAHVLRYFPGGVVVKFEEQPEDDIARA